MKHELFFFLPGKKKKKTIKIFRKNIEKIRIIDKFMMDFHQSNAKKEIYDTRLYIAQYKIIDLS